MENGDEIDTVSSITRACKEENGAFIVRREFDTVSSITRACKEENGSFIVRREYRVQSLN